MESVSVKGMIYVLIILLIGGIGGYLAAQKVDAWRASKSGAVKAAAKAEDLSATINEMLNREKIAYQNHDADQLLDDCLSNYTEVDENTGESMDLARARLYYHQYFHDGQAINLTFENVQIASGPNAVVAQASYKKTSNAFNERKIQGYIGQGTWVFVRQNATWRLASLAWTENSF